jgi:O-Antigen ligase
VTSTPAAVSTASAAPPGALAHPTLAQVPAWLLAFAVVLVLGADNGGYSPTTWGWSALVLFAVAALTLVLRTELRLGRLEVAFALGLLAFFAWGLLSTLWTPSLTQPLLESQRTMVYVAGALAALLLARSRSYHALLAGAWTAIALVCSYSLLTRLVPDRLGFVDTLAGYRLAQPVGYWNALGIFAAVGTLLALGFALRSRYLAVRVLAAASTVPLISTLYFTFSRGAWIALGAGLLAVLALDPRRLQLVSGSLAIAPWPALAVWRASGSDPLTHLGATLPAAAHAGHRFLLIELLLVFAAGVAGLVFAVVESRLRLPRALRFAYAGALVAVVAVGLAAVVVRFGSAPTIAHHLYRDVVGPSATSTSGNLNRRLFTLSGGQRIPQWKVAWREYEAHPWLGSGLGTYERWWNQLRPGAWKVRNTHNLYLETLAEVGPVGLGLLAVALGLPLVVAVRARRRALAAAGAGAYVAFVAHAAVDWDWQMPAVTLAALFIGAALLVAARRPAARAMKPRARLLVLAGVLALAAFSFVGLRGNQAIAAAEHARGGGGDLAALVADSRRASRWAPWSARPWQLRGEAELEQHRLRAARVDLRTAASKDPADWSIWLSLALASDGRERRHALAEAARLNPLHPVITSFRGG